MKQYYNKEYKKKYYEKNKEKIRNYYKKTFEKIKTYRKTIRAEIFVRKHKELKSYVLQLKKLEEEKFCPSCGIEFNEDQRRARQSFDHIIPGIEKIENIKVICYKCNIIKNNLTKEELFLLSKDQQKTIKNKKPLSYFDIDEKRFNRIYWNKRGRAKSKGIEFSITKEDLFLMLVKRCPILKTKLYYGGGIGSCKDNLFSIDRIDSNLGYVPGNCRIMSFKANRAKGNADKKQIKQIYNYVNGVLTGQLG